MSPCGSHNEAPWDLFGLVKGYLPVLAETAHMNALDEANHDGKGHRMRPPV